MVRVGRSDPKRFRPGSYVRGFRQFSPRGAAPNPREMGSALSRSAETPQITINSIDADVPIIPPIVLLILLAAAAGAAKLTGARIRFLPDEINALKVRLGLFALMFAVSVHVHIDSLEQLHNAGSGLAFTPTAGIATGGPYSYTRNPFYTSLIFLQMPALAIAFDCGWLLFAIAPMFLWLSKVVIPGEEAFLGLHFGKEYAAFLDRTPRWLL